MYRSGVRKLALTLVLLTSCLKPQPPVVEAPTYIEIPPSEVPYASCAVLCRNVPTCIQNCMTSEYRYITYDEPDAAPEAAPPSEPEPEPPSEPDPDPDPFAGGVWPFP